MRLKTYYDADLNPILTSSNKQLNELTTLTTTTMTDKKTWMIYIYDILQKDKDIFSIYIGIISNF